MKYRSLNQYTKEMFGEKVYKIALDGGFTCPNRDGTLGTAGCIFCSEKGSGDFAENRVLSITEQIECGKQRIAKKFRNEKYIAYFQAFTNTYAPTKRLRNLYEEALSHPDIVAISIATRPDCLPEETIALLAELNQKKPVWVELGLQTIHEKSAAYIRRGYPLSVFDDAVRRLKQSGLEVIVHIIFGIPGETKEQMLETVRYVGNSGVDGVKIHLLHVLRGTDLEQDYRSGKFQTLTMEEYANLVAQAISILPEQMVIHRMTGDGDKKNLVAPLWSSDKKRVLNQLKKTIEET